jgi:hypothetical protein
MIATSSMNDVVDNSQDVEGPIQVLLRLAATARVYRSADGGLHARVAIGGRHEIYGIRSAGFRDWLIDGYFVERSEPPSSAAILRVVSLMEARARFDGGTPPVCIRVAGGGDQSGSAYFLDLGDSSGAAVKICARGWEVVDRPEIHFKRPGGLLPLPVPSRGGSIELLRPYVNVDDDGFRLVIAWLTAALRPVGPYPILSLHGEQGSAKSTLARILRMLIDPQACALMAEPASTRDLMVTAINGWLLAYDNITTIPDWLSDSLCRVVFGGGFSGRALYSDDERNVIFAQRPVILNGIEDYVRKSDLIDRTVFLHLPSMSQNRRRAEDEFWGAFRAEHSLILGGVLDALVGGLRELPSVKLSRLPRMADFAKWGDAVNRGLGWDADAFISAFEGSRKEASETSLESSPVGSLLLELASTALEWESSPTELLQMLTERAGKKVARSPGWPKSPQRLTNELRRIAPQLRMHGLSIIFSRTGQSRCVAVMTAEYLASFAEMGAMSDPN